MRNQTWTNGKITEDIEIYLEDSALKAKDCLTGEIRDATGEEGEEFFYKPPRDLVAEIDKLKARLDKITKVNRVA